VRVKVCPRALPSIRSVTSLLVLGVCTLGSGCHGSETIWSAEARSPDGKMIATAKIFENSGFGTGGGGTTVYLNWTTEPQPPMLILAFSDGATGGKSVGMNWLTPTHLELTYKGHRTVEFQAARCAGIDISVRDVSSEPGQGPD